jgi:hypothetical protein
MLNLWIWDNLSSGLANKSTCIVTINLQDNQNVCDNIGTGNLVTSVSGTVTTEDLEMVDNVEISIESNVMYSDMMSNEGEFAFNNLSMYNDYQVDAFKDDDYLNGVSTLDLVLIQRHILGLENLDSPYKLIAADINNSETITAIDLIELRKLILGLYTELPNNNSWRFVESAYTFVDLLNPFPFAENVEIDNLEKEVSDADFIGVKIGDVNASVISNVKSSKVDSRSLSILNVDVLNSITSKGNERLQFVASENINLLGSQFSISFDAQNSNLLAMIPMTMELTNENVAWDRVEDGQFIVSWNTDTAIEVKSGDVLFELLFKGDNADVNLSNYSKSIAPEIYSLKDGFVLSQQIKFNGDLKNAYAFEVQQNVPNPFKDETDITFTMEKEGPVVFTITDQTGRLIYTASNRYNAGNNSIKIYSSAINTTGLLYYTIATESKTVTKKMIVLQ